MEASTDLIKIEGQGIVALASQFSVKSAQDFEQAGELRLRCVERAKRVEEMMRPHVDKAFNAHKELLKTLKDLKNPFDTAATIIKGRMIFFEQLEKRRQQAERARLEAEARKMAEEQALELAVELDKAGAKAAAEEVLSEPVIVAPVPVAEPIARPNGFSYRKAWKFKIVDASKIPRKYLIPDETLIGAEVRRLHEATNIDGIEVFAEEV